MVRLVLAASVVLAGCGPLAFTTQVQGELVIPGSATGGVLNVFPALTGFGSLNFDDNTDFKAHKVTRGQVTSVRVESLQVKIVSPSTQDFGFIDSVQFFARAGESEALIAEKPNVSSLSLGAPNPTLTLDVPSVELGSYVAAPSVSFVMRGRGRQPPQDTRLSATLKLLVQAKSP